MRGGVFQLVDVEFAYQKRAESLVELPAVRALELHVLRLPPPDPGRRTSPKPTTLAIEP
ncbi:MAG: hypothetical protein M0Z98_07460 [Actinomycetales bacterium]|nr:hypothetical protein [Actinomycetales bacterium]